MYPHIRFAAYLVHMQYDLEKYIRPLPCPEVQEVALYFPNIPPNKTRKANRWRKEHGIDDLVNKTDIAKAAYKLWKDERTRGFLTVAIIRSIGGIPDMLRKHFRVSANDDIVDFYKKMFFDISDASVSELYAYKERLTGYDADVFEKSIRDISTEVVLKDIGIQPSDINIDNLLDDMIVKASSKFSKDLDINWGKFFLSLVKTRDGREDQDKKNEDIFKEMRLELRSMSESAGFIKEDGDDEPIAYTHGPPPIALDD